MFSICSSGLDQSTVHIAWAWKQPCSHPLGAPRDTLGPPDHTLGAGQKLRAEVRPAKDLR